MHISNLVKSDNEHFVWHRNCFEAWGGWRDNCRTSRECGRTDRQMSFLLNIYII